jgi:hypothetical protein
MPVHSISEWKIILSGTPIWTASEFLLRNLMDYPRLNGPLNESFEADMCQTENYLSAFASVSHCKASHKTIGTVALICGDLGVKDWRCALDKVTVREAAELIAANIFSPDVDYSWAVKTLTRALTAFGEMQLADHGIGTSIAPEPSPNNAA